MGRLGKIMRAFGEFSFYSEPADLGIPSYDVGELIPCRSDGNLLVVDTSYHPDLGWRYDLLRNGILHRNINESVLEDQLRE